MPLGILFANRVHHCTLAPADLEGAAQQLSRVTDPLERAVAEEAVSRGREEVGWSAINQMYLEQLRREVDMPLVEIPFAFAEEFGAVHVQSIAAAIAPTVMRTARRAQGNAQS